MNRASGVLMHVSSLYNDYSIGSFGKSCYEFIDFLSESGFSYWQVLPFNLPDEYNSPYKSYSAFSGNPYFIDLEILNKKGLITDGELKAARQKTPYVCEFERLKKERISLLKSAAARCDYYDKIYEFLNARTEIYNFCVFMALKEQNGGKPWTEWTIKEADAEEVKKWAFTQYEFYIQWQNVKSYANAKNIKIIGDIPMYVDLDSADVRGNPSQFLLGDNYKPSFVAGVPPDYFSEDGQVWGNPLYNYSVMKKDGFAWWKKRVSYALELFDGVRIDHFRGFESYFCIPYGEKTAKTGKWKKGAGINLINAIKSVSTNKLIIAEDLGDITDEVKKLVDKSSFPGMRVMQFGFLGDFNSTHLPHNYENNCVAYTGTHDNNTLLGYVWELDENTRKTMLEYFDFKGDWNDCYDTVLASMLRSGAGIVIFPVQDLLKFGADTRLNTPGLADKNWSYRITKEQFSQLNANKFKRWNVMFGRSEK